MLQFIAVLAIVALLVVVLLPNEIRQADRKAWLRESAALEAFSQALVKQAVQSRGIPALADFPQSIAAAADFSLWQVRTNDRRLTRVFLVDPNLDINGAGLPYTQTGAGAATRPTNARVLMLATIAGGLPTVSANDFDAIWDTPEGTVPAALATTWGGNADDLLIQRLDLGRLFHRVQLINVDVENPGYFSIDNGSMDFIPGRATLDDPVNGGEAWFLDGTVLHFYRPNQSPDCREILREDLSFVYHRNRWQRRIGALDDSLGEFGEWVSEFLKPPAPTDPKFAATQRAVVGVFFDYLWGYARWAFGDSAADPPVLPFAGAAGSSTPQYPSYAQLYQAQGNLATFTSNLIE